MKVIRISITTLMVFLLMVAIGYGQSAEEYVSKGIDYAAAGKFDKAQQEFKKALEIDQSHKGAKQCLETIEDVLKQKLEKKFAVHLFKGVAYNNKRMLDEAIEEFKKAISITPNSDKAHTNLGMVYYNKGMLDEAIDEWKKAIAIKPNDALAYFNLGQAYGLKRMWDKAIVEFKKAVAINPNFEKAHNDLAVAYFYEKQYQLAIKHCDRAIQLGYRVQPKLLEALKPYREYSE